MAKKGTKKSPRKKLLSTEARHVQAVRVPIEETKKISHRDVHMAIQKHLARVVETDLFCNDEILVIVVEKHGN